MRSQITELEEMFQSGTLVFPDPARPNTVALTRAISEICGGRKYQPDSVKTGFKSALGFPRHLVHVVADGFGMNFVKELSSGSFCKRHLNSQAVAAFPSSTGPNLVSHSRAEWPGVHGVLGWYVYLPELRASTAPFQWIRTKDETNLSELGITGELVYQGCPVNQSFEYSVANFISSEYSDSIATNSLHALGTVIGFSNLDDVLAKAIQRVDSTSGSTYTYFHWPIIDKYAHEVGTDGEKTLEVVLEFDRKMQQLRGLLPDDATLVISADHGHLNYPEGHRIQVQQSDPIRELLFDAPSGDERAAIFHVNDGSEEEFEQTFNERFGDRFLLLRRSEVIEQKLLGPDSLSDVTSGRLGQFMAISKGSWGFSFRDGPSRAGFELRSQHGGLTPDEMLVPVIIA